MLFGAYVVGEYKGVNPDTGFGSTLRIRVGEPSERSKDGYEERIEFFPFDPQTGERTLPSDLRQGEIVMCAVKVKSKAYNGKLGVGAMSLFTLVSIRVLGDAEDAA